MTGTDPWNNEIDVDAFRNAPTTPLETDPMQRVFIGGRDELAVTGECSAYFAGTDVTGPLHLGHLYCFAAAGSIAEHRGGRFMVSINEIESGLSRQVPAVEARRNAATIRETLQECSVPVHSRLHDSALVYAACSLFGWLLRDRLELVQNVYGSISGFDLFSICPMALTPVFLGREEGSTVCAVYGYDEVKNVEFIYRLYRAKEFRNWIEMNQIGPLPTFTYILTPLIAGSDRRYKMSKSRQHDALPWNSNPTGTSGDMFPELHGFVTDFAPLIATSPLGAAVAQHAGRNHAVL